MKIKYLFVCCILMSLVACGNVQESVREEGIILETNAPSEVITPQGGCTDGAYFYQAYIVTDIDQLTNVCKVVKYDLKTGECIKESEILQLNHANDMTYNSKLDCLVIAHNAPVANCITCLNPKTLEVVDHFSLDHFIYSIAYNEVTDQYVVGLASSQDFCILNSEFKAVSEVFSPSDKTEDCTTQGMAVDEDFIYFVLYKPNVISVYDWQGNFVTLLELEKIDPLFYEPENISVVDDTVYIGCGCNGKNGGLAFCVFRLPGLISRTEWKEAQSLNQGTHVRDEESLRELLLLETDMTITVTADIESTEVFFVKGTKTLHGSSFIQRESFGLFAEQAVFELEEGAELTVNGLTVDGQGMTNGYMVHEGAKLTYLSGIIQNVPYGIKAEGSVVVEDIIIRTTGRAAVNVLRGGDVILNGGTYSNSGFYNLRIHSGASMVINEGVIAEKSRIYNVYNEGVLKVNGGIFQGANKAAINNEGKLEEN